MRRGLARLLQVINKCACTSISAFLSIFVPRIAWVPVSFLYYESLSGTWAFSVKFSFLIGPRCPHGNDVKNECKRSPFLAISLFTLTQLLSCQETGTRTDQNKQASQKKITRENEGSGVGLAISLSYIRGEQSGAGIIKSRLTKIWVCQDESLGYVDCKLVLKINTANRLPVTINVLCKESYYSYFLQSIVQ